MQEKVFGQTQITLLFTVSLSHEYRGSIPWSLMCLMVGWLSSPNFCDWNLKSDSFLIVKSTCVLEKKLCLMVWNQSSHNLGKNKHHIVDYIPMWMFVYFGVGLRVVSPISASIIGYPIYIPLQMIIISIHLYPIYLRSLQLIHIYQLYIYHPI